MCFAEKGYRLKVLILLFLALGPNAPVLSIVSVQSLSEMIKINIYNRNALERVYYKNALERVLL